ncbi:hypothetical protein L2E82_22206 [Cichorium intybus]|uniref:Uncharacterized protein n=1 Tax=Cichorium intybus TaxID=13427 RepID=A0ACB9DXI5_CICIN|nr:hypothetical protein L2E82_22206 [Cichorium intybus]
MDWVQIAKQKETLNLSLSSLRLSLFPTPQFSSRVVALPPSGAPLLHATALALHSCCLLFVAEVSTDVTIKSRHHSRIQIK